MTAKEKYAIALQNLIEAQKEVEADNGNPFNFTMPGHTGLSNETFISGEELDKLSNIIGSATQDNNQFAKIWNIGSEVLLKAKALLL